MPRNLYTGSWHGKLKDKIRHGLLVHSGKNCLRRAGIEITPYYWVQEGMYSGPAPKIRGGSAGFSAEFLGEDDMSILGASVPGVTEQELLGLLKRGKKCFGIRYRRDIAAFMWVSLDECTFAPAPVRLKANEAYLYNMHTFEAYRGRNIAPHLRYRCYQALRKQGRDTFFSVTEFFNYSALRYKEKLGARNLKLVLHVGLFKKLRWSITLKRYPSGEHFSGVSAAKNVVGAGD